MLQYSEDVSLSMISRILTIQRVGMGKEKALAHRKESITLPLVPISDKMLFCRKLEESHVSKNISMR